jgi:hypothetical protein
LVTIGYVSRNKIMRSDRSIDLVQIRQVGNELVPAAETKGALIGLKSWQSSWGTAEMRQKEIL